MMKKIVKIAVVIVFVFSFSIIKAQKSSLTIEASQNMSSFTFLDSESNKQNSEYQSVLTGAYGLGYRYNITDNIFLRVGLGMRNGGASLVYDEINYSWKLQYLDVKLGGGYMYPLGKFVPYLMASGYYGYLLRGIQEINNEEFNITESGILNKSDVGVVVTPGVKFTASDYISVFAEFNYIQGLYNIEMDENQKAKNISFGLSLGLLFSITKGE